jgi:S1-C subfamily serine protease
VLIRGVEPDSAAQRAGLERGDLIVSVGGADVSSVDVVYDALDRAQADGELELRIVRGTDERDVKVAF